MNTRILWAILALALLAVPRVAVSDGIYVGASVGSVQIEDDSPGYAIDDSATLTRIVVGVEANRKIALEGVYFASERTDPNPGIAAASADFRGLAVYVTGPLSSGYRGYGQVRAGLFTGRLDVESTIGDFRNDATGLALGAGYVYQLNDFLAIRGDLDTFVSDFDSVSSLSIGLQLRFGN